MRALTAQDAKAMAALHAQSFAPPFGTGGWDALEMATHTRKDVCYGLDIDDELAAFILVSKAAGQAEILTLATDPAHRRQGLAQQLLRATSESLRAAGVAEIFLEVAEDNTGAIALYRGAGFAPIGRRPAYYRRAKGRVAALTFAKKLDGTLSAD